MHNALAIRTLTALGVPPRFTYITFDHLMTQTELRATYAFQGRSDLLLRAVPELGVDEIVDGVRGVRRILKDAAYRLFGGMLDLSGKTDNLTGNQEELAGRCGALAEALINDLHAELASAIAGVEDSLPAEHYRFLRRAYTRWAGMKAWRLINVGDPCGT